MSSRASNPRAEHLILTKLLIPSILFVSGLMVLASALPAQQISVPKSFDIISGVMTFVGEEFTFSVRNGGTLRVETPDGVKAFVIEIDNREEPKAGAFLHMFNVNPGPPGEEGVEFVDLDPTSEESYIELYFDQPVEVPPRSEKASQRFVFELTHVEMIETNLKGALPRVSDYVDDPNLFLLGTCCVTCSITVCGCSVSASCGSCSSGCGGPGAEEHRGSLGSPFPQ